jgi:hypothetical protein
VAKIIMSIAPATPNWFAVFREGDEQVHAPVAVWAQMRDENDAVPHPFVTGLVTRRESSRLVAADEIAEFVGYEYIFNPDNIRWQSITPSA